MDGLKFDLRIYVLLYGVNPLRVYIFEDGLARFATTPYEPPGARNLNNLFMHLTNYAVNKDEEDFIVPKSVNDDHAHKRSLKKVLDRLKLEGQDTDKLMDKIKDIIVKTILPIQEDLRHNYRAC